MVSLAANCRLIVGGVALRNPADGGRWGHVLYIRAEGASRPAGFSGAGTDPVDPNVAEVSRLPLHWVY